MDIKTFTLLMALGNFTLGGAIFSFQQQNRNLPPWSDLLISKQCQAFAWGLLYLLPTSSSLLSGPISATPLVIGIALEMIAIAQSLKRFCLRRIVFFILAICLPLYLIAHFFSRNALLSFAAWSVAIGTLYIAVGCALALDWRTASWLRRMMAIANILLGLTISACGIGPVFLVANTDWLNNQQTLPIIFLSFYFLLLTNGFGVFLLSRQAQDAELLRLTVIDLLTGAPNHRGFFNALTPWIALARRPGEATTLLVFDLDHFKRVNDDYGHAVGDVVLRSVVNIGQKQMRDSDLIGRLGSEEFAVLLPRTALPEAAIVAERMRKAIENLPIKTRRAVIHVTASFGLTTIAPDDSTLSLMKRAHDALQEAKKQGRNRVIESKK